MLAQQPSSAQRAEITRGLLAAQDRNHTPSGWGFPMRHLGAWRLHRAQRQPAPVPNTTSAPCCPSGAWWRPDLPGWYALEGEARQAALAHRLAVRQQKSAPLTGRIRDWAHAQRAMPGSAFRKAIEYMLNLWSGLTVFLTQPQVPLGRVEHWRGDRKEWGVAVAGRLSRTARRCLNPLHDSVSSARSSNRTCGSPASGSHLRHYTASPTAG